MEILFTVAYIFLIRLIFFDYKWIKFNIYWGVGLVGFYASLILLEVIMLGQVAPLSKEAVIEGYALQIQSQWPGFIKEVYVEPNKLVKKGEPLFKMDTSQWEDRLKQKKAELVQAKRLLQDAIKLTPSGAMAREQLLLRMQDVGKIEAEVSKAQYNLSNATIYAPADGYIPILQIKPGVYHGMLNKRVFNFICTKKLWMAAKITQQAVRFINPGDKVEVALEMYPGTILQGEVDSVIWGVGNTQIGPSGKLPDDTIEPPESFFVKIKLYENPDNPLRYGASGSVTIYTQKASFIFRLIRRIEIRTEAFLNYLYNPF